MIVTAKQVKDAVTKAGIKWVDGHECSLCGVMVGYRIEGNDIYFRSGCGCSWSPDRPTTWDEAAEYINRQDRTGQWGDIAARVALRFGINLPRSSGETTKSDKAIEE